MVEAQYEMELARGRCESEDFEQRPLREIEAGAALGVDESLQRVSLRLLREPAPVVGDDLRLTVPRDALQRLLVVAQMERRAQHGMTIEGCLHDGAQSRRIERSLDPICEDVVIGRALRLPEVVEHETALQLRERIRVFVRIWLGEACRVGGGQQAERRGARGFLRGAVAA